MKARWKDQRKICQRLVITGVLQLLTPARFGGGRASQTTDMPILRDLASGKPLLPGASIAGAIRAYLNEVESGYELPESQTGLAQLLFGKVLNQESLESYLTIDDALSDNLALEFRPGVKINPKTRIVSNDKNAKGQLFDMELLEAGTTFTLNFELDLPENTAEQEKLKIALATALTGFELGEIGLGARKRRGFGECKVETWQVENIDLTDPKQLVAWIETGHGLNPGSGTNISGLLNVTLPADNRKRFSMKATFELETSLLIRSSSQDPKDPDMVHLLSKRAGTNVPILSGTSLAGAVRARALRIAHILYKDDMIADNFVNSMFGPSEINKTHSQRKPNEAPFASRAVVREREVTAKNELVQSRIRIDRFTGGTFPGALFDQKPLFGGENSTLEISIDLREPQNEHIALLLNILKDLWTGDLALGGETSVGRGRLRGRQATLKFFNPKGEKKYQDWTINAINEHELDFIGDRGGLEVFLTGGKSE